MHDNWQFALIIASIIAGIFFNQRAADRVRSDLTAQLNTMFGSLKNDIALLKADLTLLTGKVMEMTDRLSAVEVRLEDKK